METASTSPPAVTGKSRAQRRLRGHCRLQRAAAGSSPRCSAVRPRMSPRRTAGRVAAARLDGPGPRKSPARLPGDPLTKKPRTVSKSCQALRHLRLAIPFPAPFHTTRDNRRSLFPAQCRTRGKMKLFPEAADVIYYSW